MRYRWIQRQMSLLLIRKTSAILSGCHLSLNSESSLKFDIQYTVISYLGSGVGFLNIQNRTHLPYLCLNHLGQVRQRLIDISPNKINNFFPALRPHMFGLFFILIIFKTLG